MTEQPHRGRTQLACSQHEHPLPAAGKLTKHSSNSMAAWVISLLSLQWSKAVKLNMKAEPRDIKAGLTCWLICWLRGWAKLEVCYMQSGCYSVTEKPSHAGSEGGLSEIGLTQAAVWVINIQSVVAIMTQGASSPLYVQLTWTLSIDERGGGRGGRGGGGGGREDRGSLKAARLTTHCPKRITVTSCMRGEMFELNLSY